MKEKKKDQWQATHEELCNQALEHYKRISKEAVEWNSIVPKAIEFYRDEKRDNKEKKK